ncbi:MAG: hypothetical protein ACI4WW_07805 [Candidatus Coprovivens sp.]
MILTGKDILDKTRLFTRNILYDNQYVYSNIDCLILSISKFISLKEYLIKKCERDVYDCNGEKIGTRSVIYFDEDKYSDVIPYFKKIVDYVVNNGIYVASNSYDVVLNDINNNLEYDVLLIQKIRDALCHFQYSIDVDNKSIIIDNVSSDSLNPFQLKVSIPYDLLNIPLDFIDEKYRYVDRDYEIRVRLIQFLKKYKNTIPLVDKGNNKALVKNDLELLIKKLMNKKFLQKDVDSFIDDLMYKLIERVKMKEMAPNMLEELIPLLQLNAKDNKMNLEVAILYNYLSIALALDKDLNETDYKYMKTSDIQFLIFVKDDEYLRIKDSNHNNIVNMTEASYDRLCNFYSHVNEKYRKNIMSCYISYIDSIMYRISLLNRLKLKTIRNGVMHVNYGNCSISDIKIWDKKDNTTLLGTERICFGNRKDMFNLANYYEQNLIEIYSFNDMFKHLKEFMSEEELKKVYLNICLYHNACLLESFDIEQDVRTVLSRVGMVMDKWDDIINKECLKNKEDMLRQEQFEKERDSFIKSISNKVD